MTIELAEIVRATGAQVWHRTATGRVSRDDLHTVDLQQSFGTAQVDSRRVGVGDLFVALPGETTDGHLFLDAAIAAGARGCVVSDRTTGAQVNSLLAAAPGSDPRYVFQVPDTLRALLQLAQQRRRSLPLDVVGITGSIGKTTTKEIVAGVLAAHGSVLRSAGNLNTDVGLALTLLGLQPAHRMVVLEMGMYGPGEIARLASVAEPGIGIVTNVAPIHLERLGSLERIARAKSELVAALPPDGLAILNGDDPWTRAMAETSGLAPATLLGFAADCQYRAGALQTHGLDGVSFELHAEGRRIPLRTRVPGTHVVHAFLAGCGLRSLPGNGMGCDRVGRRERTTRGSSASPSPARRCAGH